MSEISLTQQNANSIWELKTEIGIIKKQLSIITELKKDIENQKNIFKQDKRDTNILLHDLDIDRLISIMKSHKIALEKATDNYNLMLDSNDRIVISMNKIWIEIDAIKKTLKMK